MTYLFFPTQTPEIRHAEYIRQSRRQWPKLITVLALSLLMLPLLHSKVVNAKQTVGFSSEEVKGLIPLLKKHDALGLTQYDDKGIPRRVTMAVRIAAKRDIVVNLFKDPSNFYYVSTLFKENTILDSHQNTMVWSWASRHKIISVTGKNSITLYPPRRADVTIEESSVGSGTFTFNFLPEGNDHTIMIFSGFLDVNSSEWLIKFLVGNNPSMKQAMNIAIGLVVLKGVQNLAQRMAQKKPNQPHRASGKSGGTPEPLPEDEVNALKPFLSKGQIFICDSHSGGRLKQVSVVDVVSASEDAILKAAATPDSYAKHIGAISNIQVQSQSPEKTVFSWTIGLSIFGLNSVNELTPQPHGVQLNAVSGDLKDAIWRWQTVPITSSQTIVAYHAFADVGSASAILDSTVHREPYLEHGLVLGSNIVMMKAMRKIVANQNPDTTEEKK